MKKVPLRKCLATNTMLPKEELIRFVRNNKGEIFIDLTFKANGRGAYIKKDKETILTAKKRKVLDRAFETKVDEKIYLEALEMLGGIDNGKN